MARERSVSEICEVALLAVSRRVRKRFIHRSREIRPVPFLHRPSTDGLILAELTAMSHIRRRFYVTCIPILCSRFYISLSYSMKQVPSR